MEFGPVVQKEISFTDISYLELWQPFRSAECNHLFKFDREYYEEQFCEHILFRPALRSGTIYAILKEGILENIHVKLYEILTSGLAGDVF